MRLPMAIVAALRWSLRHPRMALALTAGTTALGLASVGHLVVSATAEKDDPSPVALTSRVWVSSKEPGTGHQLDLVAVDPRDRDDFDYDGSVVLWRRSPSGLEERLRGGFEWAGKGRIHVRLRRPNERRFDLGYNVTRCNEGVYDVCLEIGGMPEGPMRYFSNAKLLRTPERAPMP